MAFVKARIEIVSALIGTGIKVSLRRGTKSAAKMVVGISTQTARDLGWADGDKLEVLIGDGEHHGLMRLRKNNSVGEAKLDQRETAKGAWFALVLGYQPAFVDRSETARWCQWEKLDEGWIEVVLPKWADETAPKKLSVAPSAPSGVKSAGEPVRRIVSNNTASIMGDPPTGRREMLKKISEIAKT